MVVKKFIDSRPYHDLSNATHEELEDGATVTITIEGDG
jgi:hypothetical protein